MERTHTKGSATLWLLLACVCHSGCGAPQEAPRVQVPVATDPSGIEPVTTDLGYRVELSEARAIIEDLRFTIAGEVHTASLWQRWARVLLPRARAHPGHHQDGDVTGEMRGRFVIDWLATDPASLGDATLIAGTYKSVNFTLARGTTDDGLAPDDPLLGHTALLRGTASKSGNSIAFVARIASPEGRELIGAPFEQDVGPNSQLRLGLRLLPRDPFEGDTLFDGIDFAALPTDANGTCQLAASASDTATQNAYYQLRRTFQTHDHFAMHAIGGEG